MAPSGADRCTTAAIYICFLIVFIYILTTKHKYLLKVELLLSKRRICLSNHESEQKMSSPHMPVWTHLTLFTTSSDLSLKCQTN